MSRQILSNHLACLRGCGLVVAEPEGRRSRYRAGRRADRPCTRRSDRPGARPSTRPAAGRRSRRLLLMSAPVRRGARSSPAASGCWSPPPSPTTSWKRRSRLAEGTRVSSSALFGFGLDSVIEVSSAAAVAWQFAAKDPETREKAACGSSRSRSSRSRPTFPSTRCCRCWAVGEARPSPIGIALAAASLVIMPVLSLAQRRAGRELGSRFGGCGFEADAALHVPVGRPAGRPGAQRLLGWSWADPVAALGHRRVAVREGRNAWRGDPCC